MTVLYEFTGKPIEADVEHWLGRTVERLLDEAELHTLHYAIFVAYDTYLAAQVGHLWAELKECRAWGGDWNERDAKLKLLQLYREFALTRSMDAGVASDTFYKAFGQPPVYGQMLWYWFQKRERLGS